MRTWGPKTLSWVKMRAPWHCCGNSHCRDPGLAIGCVLSRSPCGPRCYARSSLSREGREGQCECSEQAEYTNTPYEEPETHIATLRRISKKNSVHTC